MPRNMSFSKTTPQVRARTKTVTRRTGWWFLKPGEIVNAIEKGQGLKKGEEVVVICQIRIVSTRPEPLSRLIKDTAYGFGETTKEGFKDHPELQWPGVFAEFFCALNGCELDTEVNRIEFEYV